MNRGKRADVAELADAHDSKSCGAIRAGSSPAIGSKIQITLSSLDFLHRKTLAIGGRKRSYVICKLEKKMCIRDRCRLVSGSATDQGRSI